MKIIVGLGNPGKEYHLTRHNVGFLVMDLLARRNDIQIKSRRDKALSGEGFISGEKVVIMEPMTFMNLSGQAVSAFVRKFKLEPSDVIVVCDDVNLPLGKLRIRAKGSAGGHNGLKSIIQSLASDDFIRVRVGVGSPRGDMINHVLSRFHKAEIATVQDSVDRAADAVEAIIGDGIESAMNRFNASLSQI